MDNLRGAGLMTLAMLGFAIEDAFIKMIASALPTWEIILFIGFGGACIFSCIALVRGMPLFSRSLLTWPILIRNLGELVGTMGFVTAIALTPISLASAILQTTPLFVTLGAALFLGEPVGWRRWTAIIVGFLGVLLVIRPGLEGFDARALYAVLGVIGLGIRDLAIRFIPPSTSSLQLSVLGFGTLIPAAAILAVITGQPYVNPEAQHWGMLAISPLLGVFSYYAIVAATRIGDVSFVTPFRYSRMIFALAFGVIIFSERPDALMLTGTAIIIASGLYTLWRERKVRSTA